MHLVIVQSYSDTEKKGDLRLVLAFMTTVASPRSNLDPWQLACIHDSCRIPGSCNPLFMTFPTTQWVGGRKLDLLNARVIRLTTEQPRQNSSYQA